ncbi:hypothetical protein [Natrinema gelatinilyticum]|uniref:hypothetical protein n=1 Tax=Natrinema gelatinilyticum TaxID=2961571 RepID=UPI0020C37C15|nr:hypothetical protein [Natrinema gelatinilyticum]
MRAVILLPTTHATFDTQPEGNEDDCCHLRVVGSLESRPQAISENDGERIDRAE